VEAITGKRGISTAPDAVAWMVSQVGHVGQHRLWAPEELADETIGASRFLVIVSSVCSAEGIASGGELVWDRNLEFVSQATSYQAPRPAPRRRRRPASVNWR
jgi:hypothetical protein